LDRIFRQARKRFNQLGRCAQKMDDKPDPTKLEKLLNEGHYIEGAFEMLDDSRLEEALVTFEFGPTADLRRAAPGNEVWSEWKQRSMGWKGG
jgi:hypothetical protein